MAFPLPLAGQVIPELQREPWSRRRWGWANGSHLGSPGVLALRLLPRAGGQPGRPSKRRLAGGLTSGLVLWVSLQKHSSLVTRCNFPGRCSEIFILVFRSPHLSSFCAEWEFPKRSCSRGSCLPPGLPVNEYCVVPKEHTF